MPKRTLNSDAVIHPELLDVLLHSPQPLRVDDLAAKTRLSPKQVLHELERLGEAGCCLEVHPHPGVALVHTGLASWPDYLRWALSDGALRSIQVYRQTSSTQDVLRRTIENRGVQADGAVAVADEQTAGRGRLGRKWVAPAGTCLLFSRACVFAPLPPGESAERSEAGEETWKYSRAPLPQPSPAPGSGRGGRNLTPDLLVFATAVAVARAIEQVTKSDSLPVQIKWPNDILIAGKKIAGILVETFNAPAPAAIIGVGINVHLTAAQLPTDMPELASRLTSLALLHRPIDRLLLLVQTLREMDAALAQTDTDALLAEWRQRSLLLGADVTVRSDDHTLRGHVIDLDPCAGLILRTTDGALLHLHAATTTVVGVG